VVFLAGGFTTHTT